MSKEIFSNMRQILQEVQIYSASCLLYFILSGLEFRIKDNLLMLYEIWFYTIFSLIILTLIGTFFIKKIKSRPRFSLIFLTLMLTVLLFELISD
jgi:hypothetical protein